MLRTFNCGVGMVAVVEARNATAVREELGRAGVDAWEIGKLEARTDFSARGHIALNNADEAFNGIPQLEARYLRRPRVNVAILISGSGSNMRRLIERSQMRGSVCHVRVVVSNKAGAGGLDVAAALGVETLVVPHGKSRAAFETDVTAALRARGVQLVCLAGFMRLLTADFINAWPDRILNVHPALLPSFKGAHGVRDALAAGVKLAGCTAHYVVEDVDAGEILAQEAVRVAADDTEESLHAKIQVKEHAMYPDVMEAVARKMLAASA